MNIKKPVLLMILDGFGIRKDPYFNGILTSHMDFYFSLWNSYPHLHLQASGPGVGLPEGQIGSSEVGHLTLGAGRIIKQPLVRINDDFANKTTIKKHPVLLKGLSYQKKQPFSSLHIMGLLSPGGVHSHEDHLFRLLEVYDESFDFSKGDIYIHCFGDGRDVAQQSILLSLEKLEQKISSLKHSKHIHIASICGRYYAMDRDKREERTKKAFELLCLGKGEVFSNYKKAITSQYNKKIYDEFLEPIIIEHEFKPISSTDLVVWYNFRADRPQQLVSKLLEKNLYIQTLTEYNPKFNVDVFYPTLFPKHTFGEIISKAKKTQLRIAESEKFPHVTYFFNGLQHTPFPLETDIKISSPKVATYDLQPEMSSEEVTRRVCKEIRSGRYDFILLNFANSDMVGHTGNLKAVQKALSQIDTHIKTIKETLDEKEGTLIITADHGNCETMIDEHGKPHTKHTYNVVPFIFCDSSIQLKQQQESFSLAHVAPTLLEYMNIPKPKEMTESLLK
jgi:2,3-bisphosphoglycerate-independent phosphoglycerate mutase